jgi:hypothetical protein
MADGTYKKVIKKNSKKLKTYLSKKNNESVLSITHNDKGLTERG